MLSDIQKSESHKFYLTALSNALSDTKVKKNPNGYIPRDNAIVLPEFLRGGILTNDILILNAAINKAVTDTQGSIARKYADQPNILLEVATEVKAFIQQYLPTIMDPIPKMLDRERLNEIQAKVDTMAQAIKIDDFDEKYKAELENIAIGVGVGLGVAAFLGLTLWAGSNLFGDGGAPTPPTSSMSL